MRHDTKKKIYIRNAISGDVFGSFNALTNTKGVAFDSINNKIGLLEYSVYEEGGKRYMPIREFSLAGEHLSNIAILLSGSVPTDIGFNPYTGCYCSYGYRHCDILGFIEHGIVGVDYVLDLEYNDNGRIYGGFSYNADHNAVIIGSSRNCSGGCAEGLYFFEGPPKPTPAPTPYVPCSNWKQNPVNGHWYKHIYDSKTWMDAKLDCESMGGYLVSIETKVESDWLKEFSLGSKVHMGKHWLGASDRITEGVWVWESGEIMTYSCWLVPIQDDDSRNYCRGSLHTGQYTWSPLWATWVDRYICERTSEPATPSPTPQLTPTPQCNIPLQVKDIRFVYIVNQRSLVDDGWIIQGLSSIDETNFGSVMDKSNTWNDGTDMPTRCPLKLQFNSINQNIAVQEGDILNIVCQIYDEYSHSLNVILPEINSNGLELYVGANGNTYWDDTLCDLAKGSPTPIPTATIPTPTPVATIPIPSMTPTPKPLEGSIGVFRPETGLWAIKNLTRTYFGGEGDIPLYGDFSGNGVKDIGIFRPTTGLWAIKGFTRTYFGEEFDLVVPRDYDGSGSCDLGIFRKSSGLWAIKGITRSYFGGYDDRPVGGDYDGDGTAEIGIFRPASGLWAIRGISRLYFGGIDDTTIPGDYTGDGTLDYGIFRGTPRACGRSEASREPILGGETMNLCQPTTTAMIETTSESSVTPPASGP